MTENAEQQVNEKICKCAHQSQTDRQQDRARERGKGGCGGALQVDVVYALFHGLMDGDAICD